MQILSHITPNLDKRIFLLIFVLFFTVFLFTSDGHRSTSDEEFAQQQSLRIILQQPDPEFVPGDSDNLFKYPQFRYPHPKGPICSTAILCYPAGVFYSITEVPFIFINHNLHILKNESFVFTIEDFNDAHYVWWRNSFDPDLTFMELTYGPFYSALSVAFFFLICRSFNFQVKTSVFLVLILGLSTSFFAYSQTSFNQVASVCFLLGGFLYFKKFFSDQKIHLILISSIFLLFSFLIRNDVIFFILPMIILFSLNILKQDKKILKALLFFLPLILGYLGDKTIESLRYITTSTPGIVSNLEGMANFGRAGPNPFYFGSTGILLSPGAGLFIYIPILLTVFFSFPDFRKNKQFSLLFISFSILFIIHFGSFPFWEGYTAWSPKYLYEVIPFMLLPLGASIEKRGKKILPIITILGGLGLFFNIVYVIQDVGWFVWGQPGGYTGLMGLAQGRSCSLYICPEVTWTFQFSPLIKSIELAFTNLQPDLFLLKLFGATPYVILISLLISIESYVLYRLVKSKLISKSSEKPN